MSEVHQHPTEKGGPSTSQILSVVALFPFGGVLLTLSGLILAGTLVGLAFSAPLLVIFSPILVPAVFTLSLAVAGFLTAGAFGVTALSSVLWLLNYVRRMSEISPQDKAGYMGRMRS